MIKPVVNKPIACLCTPQTALLGVMAHEVWAYLKDEHPAAARADARKRGWTVTADVVTCPDHKGGE